MYNSILIDTLSAPATKPDTTSTFCSREHESEGESECECEERVKPKYRERKRARVRQLQFSPRMSTSHTLLIKQEMWNVEAHGRIKDTKKECNFCLNRSNGRDGKWVLRTLRLHYTVMQFHVFQKFKRWTEYLIKTYKSTAHYSWALETASSTKHKMSISKQRVIILRKLDVDILMGKLSRISESGSSKNRHPVCAFPHTPSSASPLPLPGKSLLALCNHIYIFNLMG